MISDMYHTLIRTKLERADPLKGCFSPKWEIIFGGPKRKTRKLAFCSCYFNGVLVCKIVA